MEKLCKRCGQISRHRKRTRGGFICYCWECEKEKSRQAHRDRKNYIVELLGNQCSLCGIEDHPCIYDAHHINQDGKIYNCSLVSNRKKLIKELSKCELLCVRCHRLYPHIHKVSQENRVWKKCQKCNKEFWHDIRKRHKNLDSVAKRQGMNRRNQKKMIRFWELGKTIYTKHNSKKWSFIEWDLYCKSSFGMGRRGVSDYERLFKEFSVDDLPSSLNGVRTKNHTSNLLDEKNTQYVHNICVRCVDGKRKDRKLDAKQQAIDYMGGECYSCGLVVETQAFDFHHLGSLSKDFKISASNVFNTRLVAELDKCILLCCYCHRKVHSGVLSFIDPLDF